LNKKVAASV